MNELKSFSKSYLVAFFLSLCIVSVAQYGTYPAANPVELGKVKWLRNYEDAQNQSKILQKPILILFQEVPGCRNCTRYGQEVLSHPLLVEAIESYFVPLCIYNNASGDDKQVLKKFNEPAWNNPVLRIIHNGGKDITPRQSDFRSFYRAMETITDGISNSGQKVPEYLRLLMEESYAEEHQKINEVYLSMFCFWSGEKEIGTFNGIISTEAGFMHGKEVVKIRFDQSRTSLDDIVQRAKKSGNADAVYGSVSSSGYILVKPAGIYKKDREDKYYLRNSKYAVIPMTELQKTKVNAAIGKSLDPEMYLSPRQLEILKNKMNKTLVSDRKMTDIWYKKIRMK